MRRIIFEARTTDERIALLATAGASQEVGRKVHYPEQDSCRNPREIA